MKSFIMISSQEGRCGYIEDDWQIINTINTKEELYASLKEGYLADARNRNDYPICSFPINRIYTRIKLRVGEGGFEHIDYDDENQIDYRSLNYDTELEKEIKEEYEYAFRKFKKWENKIKTLLPILREEKRKKDKEVYELKKLNELAEKYNFELIKKEEYILAEFSISEYRSTDSTSEKMIITEEEAELIKASNISLDVEDGLDKSDIYISKINKPIKDYLDAEDELSDNFWLKRFINLSNENTNEFKIDKKQKELDETYKKSRKIDSELFTLNKLDEKYRKGIDIKGLKKESDILEIAIKRLKREIGELKNV